MKLDCKIVESIQKDFNALWRCQERGNTLEISVPYLLPDSTLVTLFLTQRGERFIVCDGGGITEILSEYCPLPESEALMAVREMGRSFRIQEGELDESPLFFKECTNPKLISSLVFDVANFVTMVTSALVSANIEEPGTPHVQRFETQADKFLHSIKPPSLSFGKSEIAEVPGYRFSAVLHSSSRIWLISYVSGSTLTNFRKNVNDTAKSFSHAWSSSIGQQIARTIPVLNNNAAGYEPEKLDWQIRDLEKDSHQSLVRWSHREDLARLLQD